MSYLANEEKDEQFPEEYCSSMSHISIIYGLRNIALRQAYPCDWYFLCLINMLVHYRKLEDAQDALQAYVEKHPFNINALFYLRKFNQLFLHSKSVDEQCTKNLISLDPGHPKILNWIDDLPDPVERVRVLLNFVDFIHNQHNHKAWRTLFALMNEMWPDKNQKKIICLAYEKYFSSYWPSYHFVLDSEPVKTAKCLYYKAKCALLLRPTKLMSFTEQVADALQTINPKLEEKLRLQITFIQETLQNLAKVDVDVEEPDESMNQKDLPDQPVAADWFNDSCEEIARDSQPMTEDTLITDQEVDKENLTTRVNITLASSGQTSIDISDDDIKDDVKDLEDKLQNELIDSSINSERNFDFVRSPLSGNESFDLSNHL